MPHVTMKDGAEIYYRVVGEGYPIVFIHGFNASADLYEPQIKVFSKRYKVIAYDLRGFGRSSKPPADIYPVTLHAEDLHTLLTELKIERTALVGCSMGGCVTQQYCLDHSEKVSCAVLYGAFPAGDKFVARESTDVAGMEKSWRTVAGRVQRTVKATLSERFLKYSPDADKQLAEVEEDSARNIAPAAMANFRCFKEFDLMDQLQNIKVPTLVVCGGLDVVTPPKASEYLRDHIPGARLVTIRGGHHVNVEAPTDFNEVVETFIAEHIK